MGDSDAVVRLGSTEFDAGVVTTLVGVVKLPATVTEAFDAGVVATSMVLF